MAETTKLNFIHNNTVYIHGMFDSSISTDVLPGLLYILEQEKQKKNGSISFHINSNGGQTRYLYDLLSLVEMAKKEGVVVKTIVSACAYSCASILASSGTKGERCISEYAEHLVHLGMATTGYNHNETELNRNTKNVKKHFEKMLSIYKKYAKIPNLEKVIKDDCFYVYGQKIIDYQLADKFI